MTPRIDESYCGAQATQIVFRGRTARLFTCGSCPYEGSGRKMPYERPVAEKDRKAGVMYGPERLCGERVE